MWVGLACRVKWCGFYISIEIISGASGRSGCPPASWYRGDILVQLPGVLCLRPRQRVTVWRAFNTNTHTFSAFVDTQQQLSWIHLWWWGGGKVFRGFSRVYFESTTISGWINLMISYLGNHNLVRVGTKRPQIISIIISSTFYVIINRM